MGINQELKEVLDNLTSHIQSGNTFMQEFLEDFMKMKFRLEILWNVFYAICGLILVSGVSWFGYMLLQAIRSGADK